MTRLGPSGAAPLLARSFGCCFDTDFINYSSLEIVFVRARVAVSGPAKSSQRVVIRCCQISKIKKAPFEGAVCPLRNETELPHARPGPPTAVTVGTEVIDRAKAAGHRG